jgi:hypothetical protein
MEIKKLMELVIALTCEITEGNIEPSLREITDKSKNAIDHRLNESVIDLILVNSNFFERVGMSDEGFHYRRAETLPQVIE